MSSERHGVRCLIYADEVVLDRAFIRSDTTLRGGVSVCVSWWCLPESVCDALFHAFRFVRVFASQRTTSCRTCDSSCATA
jgi:hypothetical protein